MLIKLLGARFGGAGTTAAGAEVVERFARGHESGVHAVDGSGLTRSNRASPTQVVGLLKSMRGTPVGDEFIQDLALAGHEGTVADRMHGTAAYGRCRTKTGTIRRQQPLRLLLQPRRQDDDLLDPDGRRPRPQPRPRRAGQESRRTSYWRGGGSAGLISRHFEYPPVREGPRPDA